MSGSVIDLASARKRKDADILSPTELLRSAILANYAVVTDGSEVYLVPKPFEQEDKSGLRTPFEQRKGLLGTVGIAQPVSTALRPRMALLAMKLGISDKIGRGSMDKILDQLRGAALARTDNKVEIHMRFAEDGDRLTIDMGTDDGSRIEVRDGGWSVIEADTYPVFRRSRIMQPLPKPERGGSLNEIAEDVLALDPDSREFKLLIGWVLALPFASSVRPGLLLIGPPGSGKSTRIRLLASLFEPMDVAGLGANLGRNHDDDIVRAKHRAVPIWDNISTVSGETSDLICSLITGGGRERRQLYSDDEVTSLAVRRPIGLTAVGRPAGLRADALDRLITVELDAPSERLSDGELQRRFDEAHPWLLGAVLDAQSAILRHRASVNPPRVRMFGHAEILAAYDQAVENGDIDGPSGLLRAYLESIHEVKAETAADDVFGGAIIDLLERRGGHWSGLASKLLEDCLEPMGWVERDEIRRTPGWPRSPRSVPTALAHLRDPLAELGIHYTTEKARGNKTRYIFHRE